MISFQLDQYYPSRLFIKSRITLTGNDSMIIIHSETYEKYMAYLDYKFIINLIPTQEPAADILSVESLPGAGFFF